jgi:signal transduction histidine kinase
MQTMNLNAEVSLNAMAGEAISNRDLIARRANPIQSFFPRGDHQQVDREQELRLEERRKERGRIARELHDTLFQGFLGASMLLQDAVEKTPADSPIKPSLNRALRLMYRVIEEGRAALRDLRSSASSSLSLEEQLHELWDELAPGGVQFRILVEGPSKTLKHSIQEEIYLIGREAVLNALRHSNATAIEAEVEYSSRRLRVVVRDNGSGIDPQMLRSGKDSHWGLLGMRERAAAIGAQLRIWSRPHSGTEVELSVPIHIVADAHAQLSGTHIESKLGLSGEMLGLLSSQRANERKETSVRA